MECGGLPRLRVHEVHLTQLFQNLIGNALKYRADRPPRVRITAEPDGAMWRISVTDNGIGIDRDYQEQIFGLFQRLHGGGLSTPGSGIGLAICQKIVQRYGGRIWGWNRSRAAELSSHLLFRETRMDAEIGPISLLLVEDSPADVYLVREAILQEGLDVDLSVVEDGERAIEILNRVDAGG